MSTHFVYRCYDADGVLLYIGCTSNMKRRMASHRASTKKASRWLVACMARYEVTEYASRTAAREAERHAIRTEQPLFNFQDRNTFGFSAWMSRRPIGEYLIDRGLLNLALETACTCWRETREANGVDQWCAPHVRELELLVAQERAA